VAQPLKSDNRPRIMHVTRIDEGRKKRDVSMPKNKGEIRSREFKFWGKVPEEVSSKKSIKGKNISHPSVANFILVETLK